MAELVAQGPQPEQRWSRTLPAKAVTLGRGQLCDWAAAWDENISRLHAVLTWENSRLRVRRNPLARNYVFYRGQKVDECLVAVDEFFLIGRTRFTVQDSEPAGTVDPPSPLAEVTCSAEELQAVPYAEATDRIGVLAQLPGMIRFSPGEGELERRVTAALLNGIPRADAAAVVWMDPNDPTATTIRVSAPAVRRGSPDRFEPSRRLVAEAIRHRRQPVLHSWTGGAGADFTASAGFDWALCAPLPDDPAPGWALYAMGRTVPPVAAAGRPADAGQKEDLKFAGLVADIFGALRQVHDLQRRKAILESFLSPTVLAALAYQDMDAVLNPRRTDVTVLFCDLRGFSRLSEREDLEDICDRVSEALGVMSRNILDKDGVVSAFQGDSAMGFWGWPLGQDDQVGQAARAALAIRKEFQQFSRRADGHPLANFACGIGLAHGPAIAGRLGTLDQFQVGVFGPVVNRASRLESLTKQFRVPILADEEVAARLTSTPGTRFRLRRLARVQPVGMEKHVLLSELMAPRHEPGAMSEQDQRDFEAAVHHFLEGRWPQAQALCERLPGDGPSQTLLDFVRRTGGQPPKDWNGVIVLTNK